MSAVPTSQHIGSTTDRIADQAAQTVHRVRDRIMPAATQYATQAEDLALRGVEALRDSTHHLRDRAADVSERSVRYVKDEPIKSVLIAAAAGAAFIAILGLLSSRRTRE